MTKDLENALNEAGFDTERLDKASVREGPTWECKIGVTADKSAVLRGGADLPMRKAIEAEFVKQTGMEPDFIFSGWGAALTPVQMEIVTGGTEGGKSDVCVVGYRGKSAQPVTLMLSDGSELEFNPDDFNNAA